METTSEKLEQRQLTTRSPLDVAIVLLMLGAIAVVIWLSFTHRASWLAHWPDYSHMVSNLPQPTAWLRWVLGDISEVAFYKHEFASIGLLAGAYLAYRANRTGKTWQGFSICYGSGLWPWLVTSSLLGLLLSNLLWGWTVTATAWQPTFAAFVSLPAAMVLMFGGGWKVAINGAVMGALLVTPACLLIVNYVCNPLGLPVVIGNVSGMAVASVLAFLICRYQPGLVKAQASAEPTEPPRAPVPAKTPDYGVVWMLRRILADFSEAPFFGNEWASLGLIAGALLAYSLSPMSPAYGSGLLPQLIGAQALTSALGVIIWRRQWMRRGWYPTYIPLVSVVPAALLTYGDSWLVIISSALLGALMAPPLACAIAKQLPADMHAFIANVLSMAISTVLIIPFIGLLITL
ncbi:threonine/serine exporter family protein [Pseudomonas sp. SAICEU22]|uniref:Threonine/serine exporter family protein n=1 Tax=Pseudomonas agronomica TaxID=2979328 RepID=A0ABT3F7W8_9PSED|nr:threonine/serine exporter family protein [Pseudomonas agronomica]MCW1245178.1 threonine/serine exporter family protein [Pseudomonas agronomica]